jgi:prevent-host-death family protein
MSVLAEDSTIGVYDLKVHLSSVLEEVLAGRVVTVTRHGHPIARIQPLSVSTESSRRDTVNRLRASRKGRKLGMSTKDAIALGRR